MNNGAVLPSKFSALEAFSDWIIPTEQARSVARLESDMARIQAFYDAVLPRGEEILTYLDAFKLDDLPDPEQNLMTLMLSFAEIANAVELFHQPSVVDGFDPRRFHPVHEF
jgi:hypothetical protein